MPSNKRFTGASSRQIKKSKKQTSQRNATAGPMSYAPVAMSRSTHSGPIPRISSNGRCTHIQHSEFFTLVSCTSTNFQVTTYDCNPGVASIFPWLSKVAQRYETYKFRELTFKYHTRAATTAVGTVGLAFDFDVQDSAPDSQISALSYHDSEADAPWKEIKLRLDLAQGDKLPSRYTRVGLPPSPYDLKTLDLGSLNVFTDGVSASTVGLLEVIYSVDLFTPQIQNPIGGKLSCSAGLDATHMMGSTFTLDTQALLPGEVTATNTFTFDQSFQGLVTFFVLGTVLSADLVPVVSSSGMGTTEFIIVNAAATQIGGTFRVKAVPGTLLQPVMTATTVTSVKYYFAEAGYNSLGS